MRFSPIGQACISFAFTGGEFCIDGIERHNAYRGALDYRDRVTGSIEDNAHIARRWKRLT